MLCKECNIEIEGYNNRNNECRLFYKHLKDVHNITNKEYIIKYNYNGIEPICNCGCGNKVKFTKGRFLKYFYDHKNKMPVSKESIEKSLQTRIKNGTLSMQYRLNKLSMNEPELIEYYNEFMKFKISLRKISENTGLDKRTIRKYWKELKLINDIEQFKRVCRKHQGYWTDSIRNIKIDDYEKVLIELPNIINFIKTSKNKHTLGEIIRIFDLNVKPNFLYKELIDNYDDSIDKYIKFHNSSSSEIEFYNVLRYYFSNKVKRQYKLENRTFDFILGDKILIEYDGIYWHSADSVKLNDKYKDNLAINNGFIIIRVSETNSKDIETLVKIKKIYDETKELRNN